MATSVLFAFLGGIGPMEMLIVGVVALLLFGNRVPETMRSLGRGVKEFQDGIKGIEHDIDHEVHREPNKDLPKEPGQEAQP